MKNQKFVFFLLMISSACLLSCGDNKMSKAHMGALIASSDTAIADTESGKVAGYLDDDIYTFKGIPYAEAERFMPPEKVKAWDGIRNSRAYGPVCPQGKRTGWYSDDSAFAFDWDDGYQDENCLRINIWTPGLADGKKRPVMVWLHGGAFSSGAGQELPSYDGAALSRKGDMVIVSLNHRLNVLGFLDLSSFGEKYAKSGNAGLLDLVAALQWVQDNIANFGGDPSNVTIFGQSGGGGKVSTLLATPAAEGLFHKAIMQSGSMVKTMETNVTQRIGQATVEELGLSLSNIDEIQKVPYEQLLAAGNNAIRKIRAEVGDESQRVFIFGLAPTVDGVVLPEQPFLSKAPEQSKNIPLLAGSTMHEFSLRRSNTNNISLEEVKEILQRTYGDQTDEYIHTFAKAYPDYKPQDLIETDYLFRPEVIEQAHKKYEQQGAPVYVYMFSWESPVLDGALRATHCMEIAFVFDNIARCRAMTGGTESAYALADKVSSAWLNFAKTGNPNVKSLPTWEAFSPENGATMFLDNTCEVRYNHDKELIDFVKSYIAFRF